MSLNPPRLQTKRPPQRRFSDMLVEGPPPPKFVLARQRLEKQVQFSSSHEVEVYRRKMLNDQFSAWKEANIYTRNWSHLEPLLELEERISLNTAVLKLPDSNMSCVPLQNQFTGTHLAISTAIADIPCSYLKSDDLLMFLNILLRTYHTLEDVELAQALKHAGGEGFDFGMTYALLRPLWASRSFKDFSAAGKKAEIEFQECRQSLVVDTAKANIIVSSRLPPRRLWDLYSNRVILTSQTSPRSHAHSLCTQREEARCKVAGWYAVSHSWLPENGRELVRTPVNGWRWRVPLPRQTTLDHVRIELLNLISAEVYQDPAKASGYAWLDLLCLRQEDPEAEEENLRVREHAIDVPTIGSIYQQCHSIIQYFCGLGLPFRPQADQGSDQLGLQLPWLSRAWTLQETGSQRTAITAGIARGSPADPWSRCMCRARADWPTTSDSIFDMVAHLPQLPRFRVILEMIRRDAAHPVDKVTGLLYPLKADWLFTYNANDDPEAAWGRLINVLPSETIVSLTASFPTRGHTRHFLPTWAQLQQLIPVLNPSESPFEPYPPPLDDTQQNLSPDEINQISRLRNQKPFFSIPTYSSTTLAMFGGQFRGSFPILREIEFYSIDPSDTAERLGHPKESGSIADPIWAIVASSIAQERACIVHSGRLNNYRNGSPPRFTLVILESRGWSAEGNLKFVALVGFFDKTDPGAFRKIASITIFRHSSDTESTLLGLPLERKEVEFW